MSILQKVSQLKHFVTFPNPSQLVTLEVLQNISQVLARKAFQNESPGEKTFPKVPTLLRCIAAHTLFLPETTNNSSSTSYGSSGKGPAAAGGGLASGREFRVVCFIRAVALQGLTKCNKQKRAEIAIWPSLRKKEIF